MKLRQHTNVGFAHLPPHGRGMRIGLLGGSFNPAHGGHRLISLTAMKRMGLDAVWWLVTPGNPLKDTTHLKPITDRAAHARRIAQHPRIHITTFEQQIGTRFTVETLGTLRQRCPGVHFVWLMGADNLSGFHHWVRWREIFQLMPIAVIDRPNATLKASSARAASFFGRNRVPEQFARAVPMLNAPAWIVLHGPRSPLSSTALRAFPSHPD